MAKMSKGPGGSGQPRDSDLNAKEITTEDSSLRIPPAGFDPQEFIALARAIFLEKNQKLNGSIPHDPIREERIDHFVDTSPVVRAEIERTENSGTMGSFPEAAKRLLRCFERLCARTNLQVTETEFREQVYQHLLTELVRNTHFFGFNPRVLVTATLMSKEPLTGLPDAGLCRESPTAARLFYRAFTACPQSIERFFAVGKERMSHLEEAIKQTKCHFPHSFRITYAYFHANVPVDALLRRHLDLIGQMSGEEQFKRLPRSLIEMVVVRRKPDAVQGELQRVVKDYSTLITDPRIQAVFAGRPSDVVYAVSKHTDGAKDYLLSVAATEQRLVALYGDLQRKFSAKALRVLCLKDPTGAARLELKLKEELERGRRKNPDEPGRDNELHTWLL